MISFKMIVFIYSTELDSCGKVVRVVWTIVRILLFLLALYVFFCSLDFLSSAFKLLGGKFAFDQWIILNWNNHAMNTLKILVCSWNIIVNQTMLASLQIREYVV